jgi:hypothetical protein
VHYHYYADAPPGVLGKAQLLRGGPRAGYFQPVEISAPAGAGIALVEDGAFGEAFDTKALVGLQIGYIYRLQITNIPERAGLELFPTIELLDRLYPPRGEELRFPIPIELTEEELNIAARGGYVTRVIYLENPQQAVPTREGPGEQRYYEIPSSEDPLKHADELGRPMAILRMGSRVPSEEELTGALASGPFLKYQIPNRALPVLPAAVSSQAAQSGTRAESHAIVPRTQPDQRWMLAPVSYRPLPPMPRGAR